MNAIQPVSHYLSTHHLGNWYCAAVSVEASTRSLFHLIKAIVNLTKGFFNALSANDNGESVITRILTLSKKIQVDHQGFFKKGALELEEMGEDFFNAVLHGFGAFNPIAGVTIPILTTITMFFINDNDQESAVCKRYYTGHVINSMTKSFIEGSIYQFAVNTGVPNRAAIITSGVLAGYAAFYALGISPLATLYQHKWLPITHTFG